MRYNITTGDTALDLESSIAYWDLTSQYNGGKFYKGVGPTGTNAYSATVVQPTLLPRQILQIVGGIDKVCPPNGGEGAGGDYLKWEDSALAYAQAFGYTGGIITHKYSVATY